MSNKVRIRYSQEINAPREKVWNTAISPETYPSWTAPFAQGSNFEGSWDKGSKLRFVAPGKDGQQEGMLSEVAESRFPEFISLRHYGIVKGDEEVTSGPEVDVWAPSFENYTLTEKDGKTEFLVEMDMPEEYKSMFDEKWPNALKELKSIAEGQ